MRAHHVGQLVGGPAQGPQLLGSQSDGQEDKNKTHSNQIEFEHVIPSRPIETTVAASSACCADPILDDLSKHLSRIERHCSGAHRCSCNGNFHVPQRASISSANPLALA